MRPFATIIDSIKTLKGLKNDAQVALELGLNPKTLATMKARNSIPYEELTSFCNHEGLSLNWLLTGEGIINVPDKAPSTGHEPPQLIRLVGEAVIKAEELAKAEGFSLTREERAELTAAVFEELLKFEKKKSESLKTGKVVDFIERKKAS